MGEVEDSGTFKNNNVMWVMGNKGLGNKVSAVCSFGTEYDMFFVKPV